MSLPVKRALSGTGDSMSGTLHHRPGVHGAHAHANDLESSDSLNPHQVGPAAALATASSINPSSQRPDKQTARHSGIASRSSSSSSGKHISGGGVHPSQGRMLGMLTLLGVAFLWGSSSPSVKYLFQRPHPPSVALVTALQSTLSVAYLVLIKLTSLLSPRSAARATAAAATRVLTTPHSLATALFRRRGSSFTDKDSRGDEPPIRETGPGPIGTDTASHALHVKDTSGHGGSAFHGHPIGSNSFLDHPIMPVALRPSASGCTPGQAPQTLALAGAGRSLRGRVAALLRRPCVTLRGASMELGLYALAAMALGAWGVQRISATKVAFLGQATSVITPVLVALSGQVVPLAVWLACCCGVAGGILVATDTPAQHAAETHRQLVMLLTPDARTLLAPPHLLFPPEGVADMASGAVAHSASVAGLGLPESDSAGAETNLLGMLCVLGSCVFYSLATVRMGVHSLRFGAIDLSGGSALTFSGLALLWLLAEYLAPVPQHQSMLQKGGSDVLLGGHVTLAAQLSALMADRGAQVVCLWAGLGPGALSSVMQAVGQRRVPPAQAQVIYSTTPVFATILAQLMLPGEALGPSAWAGGAIMLGSSLAAALVG